MAYWNGTRWIDESPRASRPRRRSRTVDWVATILMFVLVPALMFAMAAGVAAKRPTGATLYVTPNAAPAWGWATASGCGYSDGPVYVDIQKPEALAFTGATSAGGCFAVSFTTDGPGTYYLQTRQQVHNRWVVMATYELPVQ